MRLLVTGATGLIGRALGAAAAAEGHEVVPLRRVRAGGTPAGPWWDPAAGRIDAARLEGFDAVVHLAGESIAARFTPRHLAEVRRSREQGTRLIATTLAGLARPPRVLVSASASGWYGDRGDETLGEDAAPGTGPLAEAARVWEDETAHAARAGIRVAVMRTGLVLTREGGALPPMLPLARLGLGGPLGSGRQWWSWVTLADVTRATLHAIATPSLAGPVNVAAPGAVRQAEFARALGRVLGRPAFLPAPAFALRIVLGRGMADSLILASARMVPRKLEAAGFTFRHPEIEPALRAVLDR